jgi:hypothetical protein
MSDEVVYLTLVAGFGFILVAGSRLGAGSPGALAGLFAPHGQRDWPTGVQEADAPRFAVRHLDDLRPGLPVVIATSTTQVDETPGFPDAEVLDLGSRRLS